MSEEFAISCIVLFVLSFCASCGEAGEMRYVFPVSNLQSTAERKAYYSIASASPDPIKITINNLGEGSLMDEFYMNRTDAVTKEYTKTSAQTIWATESTVLYTKGLEIKANGSFAVTGRIIDGEVCGAFLGIPVSNLGTMYYIMTHRNASGTTEATVTATEAGTTITVVLRLSPATVEIMFQSKAYLNGQTIQADLTMHQTFQLQCDCDLTGTSIIANHPVSVFSASMTAVFAAGEYVPNAKLDLVIEQLPDISRWGRTSLTANSYMRGVSEIFRVLASENGSTIKIQENGSPANPTILQLGPNEYYDLESEPNKYYTINSSRNVMIGQFTQSKKSDGTPVGSSFVILTPKDLYDTRLILNSPSLVVDEVSYANIFLPELQKYHFVLDDVLNRKYPTTTFSTFSYSLLQLEMPVGRHDYHVASPNIPVDGIMFGQQCWYAHRMGNPLDPMDPAANRYIAETPGLTTENGIVSGGGGSSSGNSETVRIVALVVAIVVGLPVCLLIFCFIKTSVGAYRRRLEEKKAENESIELDQR